MKCTKHALLSALLSCWTAASCFAQAAPHTPSGPVIDQLRAQGRIVLAHREASVPFSYLDADRQPVGYALDICKRLAKAVQGRLGLPTLTVEYRMVTPASRIDAIAQGQAHMECGATTNNAERRKRVAFTIPHFITGARFLVKADSAIDRIDHPDLKRVVSTRNSTPLAALRSIKAERNLPIEILEADDHDKALQMVERIAPIRATVRGEVLPAIVNHSPLRERLKRWFGY